MSSLDDKQIAKEILIELIKSGSIARSEYPDAKTIPEMYSLAYNDILKTISISADSE